MRILSLLSVLLFLSAPVVAQEAVGTITTLNTPQQDADIANRMRAILEELGNYEDVTVTVGDGIVTLRGTTNSAIEANDLDALAGRVEGVVAVKNQVTETTDIVRRLDPAVDRFKRRVDQIIVALPLAIIALIAFTLIFWVGMRIARARQPWERFAPNAFVADIYRQILRLVFGVLALVIALDIMNATGLLSTILGAAGIIGLAIGFAVKDTVENFIASVMLSFRQPFRPNDTVEINGDQGKVIRLTSRATILLSFDGNHIRIPNATVFKSRIINFSQNAERRFKFSLIVDRNADLQTTRALVADTVQQLPFILNEPVAQTWIENIDSNGVELVITGWIDQNATSINLAKGEAIRQVKLAVEAAGISITDSTQVVFLQNAQSDATAPAPALQPVVHETTEIEAVAAVSEEALDKIIAAERETGTGEDLLRQEALKE